MNSYDCSAAQLRPGQQLARVSASQGERGRVLIEGREIKAVVAGSAIYGAETAAGLPVTGDWVAARLVEPELALIEQVLPRRSRIARRAAGRRTEEQVLAANIDLAFIVCGLDGDYNTRRLERYLVTIHEGGVGAGALSAGVTGAVWPSRPSPRALFSDQTIRPVGTRLAGHLHRTPACR